MDWWSETGDEPLAAESREQGPGESPGVPTTVPVWALTAAAGFAAGVLTGFTAWRLSVLRAMTRR